jgi:hypothetical protein
MINVEPPKEIENVHPLVLWFAAQLQPAHGDETWTVAPEVLTETALALLDLAGSEDLRLAAQDLLISAWTLANDHRSPTLASYVIEVLHQEELLELFAQLGPPPPPREEQVAARAAQFNAFLDQEKKRAPQVGEKAPEGSLKIDRLNFSRRV